LPPQQARAGSAAAAPRGTRSRASRRRPISPRSLRCPTRPRS